jgi:hypothetical protein
MCISARSRVSLYTAVFKLCMSAVINLRPSQSVGLYGWESPLRVINWKVIADRPDLTFRKLYSFGLDERQLFAVQPDKHIWINTKKIILSDVGLVPSWMINITRDFNDVRPTPVDIVDIARQNLSAEFLQYTGVTFKDLVSVGLTLNMMLIMKYDITAWIHLGLYQDFLKDLTDIPSIALFDMSKEYVMLCVKEGSAIPPSPGIP